MSLRRRTDINQFWLFTFEHFCNITVSLRYSESTCNILRGSKVQVADRNQLRFVPEPSERGNVFFPGDQTGTDDSCTDFPQSILPKAYFRSNNVIEIILLQEYLS